MKKLAYLFILAGLAIFSSCTEKFQKSEKGWQYKIIKNGGTQKPEYGNFIMMEVKTYLVRDGKDTIFSDTRESMSSIKPLDSVSTPLFQYKIFSQLKKGDSAVLKSIVDSLIPKGQPYPPFAKKGQYYYETYKLVDIFKDVKEATVAFKAAQKLGLARFNVKQKAKFEKDLAEASEQMKTDDKIIQDYFAKNNITGAIKTKYGSYVVISNPGTGADISDTAIAYIKYTGKTLKDTIFDSNNNPAFPNKEPYPVAMNQFGGGVIMGWYDGLQKLKNGAKAKFFIPSTLAYGKQGSGPKIGPNEILMFDIDVANVSSVAEEERKAEEQQRQAEAAQQRMQDSMSRVQPQQPQQQPAPKK